MAQWIEIGSAFVIGLVVGSFANVLIHRLPRGQSVVWGRSNCTRCGHLVRWYDNVPLLSYVMLHGCCRDCRSHIPLRYPVVELLAGIVAAGVVSAYGWSLEAVWIGLFLDTLLVITVIDWIHRIIPDELSLGGIVFGWVGALVCLDLTPIESIIGSLVGGGLLLAIALLYRWVRGVEGMGGGDVKLMAMIGAFMGWKMIFPVLFIASLFGSIYGVYLLRRGSGARTAVAFGSFLAPAATLLLLFGPRIWGLYLGL